MNKRIPLRFHGQKKDDKYIPVQPAKIAVAKSFVLDGPKFLVHTPHTAQYNHAVQALKAHANDYAAYVPPIFPMVINLKLG